MSLCEGCRNFEFRTLKEESWTPLGALRTAWEQRSSCKLCQIIWSEVSRSSHASIFMVDGALNPDLESSYVCLSRAIAIRLAETARNMGPHTSAFNVGVLQQVGASSARIVQVGELGIYAAQGMSGVLRAPLRLFRVCCLHVFVPKIIPTFWLENLSTDLC